MKRSLDSIYIPEEFLPHIPNGSEIETATGGFANSVRLILSCDRPILVIKSYTKSKYFAGSQLMHSSDFIDKPRRLLVNPSKMYELIEFITSQADSKPCSIAQLANVLARLHDAHYPSHLAGNPSIDLFLSSASGLPTLRDTLDTDIFHRITLASHTLFPNKTLIHGDLDLSNMVVCHDKVFLIDFDEAQVASVYFEFGMLYMSQLLGGINEKDKNLEDLLVEYERIRGVELCRQSLYRAIVIMAAKFFHWRINNMGASQEVLIQSSKQELIRLAYKFC